MPDSSLPAVGQPAENAPTAVRPAEVEAAKGGTDHSEPRRDDQGSGAVRSPGGVGKLARQMASRTTDLLAIALLAATLLTFARQLTDWWSGGAPAPAVGLPTGGIDFRELQRGRATAWFEFGDLPLAWRQQSMQGTEVEAVAALRNALTKIALGVGAGDLGVPPAAGERRLLALLANQGEAGEEVLPGHEWLALEGPLSGGVVLRWGPGTERKEQRLGGRVVAWGLKVPSSAGRWNLHLFGSAAGVSGGQATQGLTLPGGRRVLVVGNDTGGQLQLWRGTGELDDWQRAVDDQLRQAGWTPEEAWRQGGQGRQGRYRRLANAGGGGRALGGEADRVEVSLWQVADDAAPLTAW
ncbi:MAG: hypothetical protein ACKOFW_10645, partial [Planctomycetaceae bacterium]